jgi:dTDP-4-amino-4,6-dideoxygalactose transaminase
MNGIDTDIHMAENCISPVFINNYPIVKNLEKNVLLVPVYPQLTKKDLIHIAKILNLYA